MTPFVQSKQERFFIKDGVRERENDNMTYTYERAVYQGMEEECHALIDTLPQFVRIIRPDGSVAYTNQRWRDYRSLLSQSSGDQKRFPHHQLDDCSPVQDRQDP